MNNWIDRFYEFYTERAPSPPTSMEIVWFIESLLKEERIRVLDLIAGDMGWEDSRDKYAAQLGIPHKYTDRFHLNDTTSV